MRLARLFASMSVEGLCSVCETRKARYSCDNCGALVCQEHYQEARGVCADCAAAGGGRRVSDASSDRPDDLLGDGVNR
jgi:hypothetical protein